MSDIEKLERYQVFIDGEWVDPATGKWMDSYNPYTAKPWALIPECGPEDADRAVQAAHRAFEQGPWAEMIPSARGALLRRLGDLIARDAERLAAVEVRDNGKLINEMGAQLKYIPQWYYYFGGLADKVEGSVIPIDKPNVFSFTRREPVGVVAAITPWNSPLLLLTWKLAPALAAGCTVVVKPSEHASASTLELMKLFEEAGFPPGVINTITGDAKGVGAPLTEHPKVAKVAFTGGEVGGRHVMSAATTDFKRVTLELGGKSPQVVFDDAELDDAVNGAISGIFAATGQTCIAGSRLLLHESIHDQFVDKLVDIAKTARMGNPMDTETQVGPVTTHQQYERVLSYMDIAKNEGAALVAGGGRAQRPECGDGWFVEPTIYTDVKPAMRIAQEEVFGPLLSVMRFSDDEEAYTMANDSNYGLAAGVWTTSIKRALKASEKLRAGTVWVNTYRAVSYLAPFGGYKRSGLGRENGQQAIEEYLETKSVWISTAESVPNPFVMR